MFRVRWNSSFHYWRRDAHVRKTEWTGKSLQCCWQLCVCTRGMNVNMWLSALGLLSQPTFSDIFFVFYVLGQITSFFVGKTHKKAIWIQSLSCSLLCVHLSLCFIFWIPRTPCLQHVVEETRDWDASFLGCIVSVKKHMTFCFESWNFILTITA